MANAHRRLSRLIFILALSTLACAIPAGLQPAQPPALPPAAGATALPLPVSTPRTEDAGAIAPFSGAPLTLDAPPTQQPFAPFNFDDAPAPDAALPRNDLNDMAKLEAFEQFTSAQQERLLQQGFIVDTQPFDSFAAAYAFGAEQKMPAFITVDAILHAFRIVADVAWQRTEATFMTADLLALSHNMALVSLQQWQQAQDDAVAAAALDNLTYFAVGSSLIDPTYSPPAPVSQRVADELTLIEQGGSFISPLFRETTNYDHFRPSAHDAGDEALARYYRARAWFAHPFSLSYAPQGNNALQPLARARHAARQAILMTWGLESSNNTTRWQRIFDPAYYFQESAASWSIYEVATVAGALYISQTDIAHLAADDTVDDFLATIHTLPPTRPFRIASPTAFALLPPPPGMQSTSPDAPILHQLTYNRVGAFEGSGAPPPTAVETAIGPIRGLPRTLDIAAVLGSSLAADQIAAAGDDDYDGYALQIETLAADYDGVEPPQWTLSYNGAWLSTLQPLLTGPIAEGFLYATAPAWQTRQLAAWHAGWLNMRYQTTLQPRPVAAIAISPEVAHGYLEPYPILYARLAALAAQIHDGLASRRLLDDESAAKLQQLQRLLEAAQTISRKQLAGQRLTADEALLLSQLVLRLQSLTTYESEDSTGVPLTDAGPTRLVDVHMEPTSGRLLQAATGDLWPIYVLVPREQGVMLTMGAIFSSYELHGEQLSPTSWRQLDTRPAPPPWLQPLIAPAATP